MTAREYIRKNLESLIGKFPHIRVRYEYDGMAEVHVVEVVPNEVYRLDDAYIKWEEQMIDGFIQRFPTQNICFVSDDALVGIRDAEYILEGLAYAPLSVSTTNTVCPKEITIEITCVPNMKDVSLANSQEQEGVFSQWIIPSSPTYRLAA